MPFNQRSLIHWEVWFPPCFVGSRIPQNPFFFEKLIKSFQNAKTQKHLEIGQNQRYSLSPEVSNLSGSVVSTMFCWTKNTPQLIFFEKQKKSSKTQKLKTFQKSAQISNTPFDQRSLIHWDAWFPPCFVGPRIPQNLIFLKNGKNSSKTQKLKNIQRWHFLKIEIKNKKKKNNITLSFRNFLQNINVVLCTVNC